MKTKFKIGDKVRRKKEYLTYGDWTYGDRVLTIKSITPYRSIRFLEVDTPRTADYFELVNESKESLEKVLVRGKSFIGKKIKGRDGKIKFTPTNTGIRYRGTISPSSIFTYFNENPEAEVCGVVEDNENTYPIEWISESIESKEVILNDKYTAKVYVDKVEVGCQTFTKKKIEEILDTMKSLVD